jgi:mRNA interferase HigB
MRVTSVGRLDEYAKAHPDAASALAAWLATVRGAKWRNIMDVRRTYSRAVDGVKLESGRVITVFNIRGNHYRLLTGVDYALGLVNVLGFLTHAEYDKDKWKGTL